MQKIDTTQIVDPTSLQPFTGRSLKFLQDSLDIDKSAIIKAFITQTVGSYSLSVPYVISGCAVSDAGKDVTAGEIFYGGKFYETTAINGTTNVARFILTKSQDAVADPVDFSDGASKNVHDIYKYVATDAASGGDFISTDLISAYGAGKITFSPTISNVLGVTSSSYADLAGATYTTPNDGVTRTWLVIAKSVIQVTNDAEGGYINITVDSVVKDESYNYLDLAGVVAVDLRIATCSCFKVISVPPNKVIKAQIKTINGGSVDFKENKFEIIQI